jgi:hypothetical protein
MNTPKSISTMLRVAELTIELLIASVNRNELVPQPQTKGTTFNRGHLKGEKGGLIEMLSLG